MLNANLFRSGLLPTNKTPIAKCGLTRAKLRIPKGFTHTPVKPRFSIPTLHCPRLFSSAKAVTLGVLRHWGDVDGHATDPVASWNVAPTDTAMVKPMETGMVV